MSRIEVWRIYMDTVELRIAMSEELVRELLWHALVPEGLVMTGALNKAIKQQQAMRGVSLDGYALSGISVAVEAGVIHAELSYTQQQACSFQKDSVRATSEGSLPASDPPAWTGSEPGRTRQKDPVRTTSEDSFPASDPPAWTGIEAGGLQQEDNT
jgi:hypothetical protein